MDEFKRLLSQAEACIGRGQFAEAEQYIRSAMTLDISAPQPHNLYGILLEFRGDRRCALKHYRAATDLDPTYMPAKNNLYRSGPFTLEPKCLDFG